MFVLSTLLLSLSACGKTPVRLASCTHEHYIDGEPRLLWEYHNTYNGHSQMIRVTENAEGTRSTVQYTLQLDPSGRVLRSESVRDGVLETVSEMTYDSKGNELSAKTVYSEEFGGYEDHVYREYDAHGNIFSVTSFLRYDEQTYVGNTTRYTYKSGRRVRSDTYSLEGALESYTEYSRDGSTETGNNYDTEGVLIMQEVNIYDGDGNILTSDYIYTGADGSFLTCESYFIRMTYTYEPLP